eukprot:gene6318-6553_t
MVWRSLSPTAARIKDRPDKLHAAAMCAIGSTLWLFGGQQGRKHLRGLHSLNTEMLSWKLVTPAGACPPGREGHSFTAVDGQVAFLFGGQGKKLYNDFYVLKQHGAEWVELKPRGKPPTPRSGHSMVWDGNDSLLCFGGTTSSGSDNSLNLYSISRNEWFQPECSGTIPSPRTHHSTVLLAPNKLLVFGGCNAQGVFFNDAYVLDIDSMQWSRTQPLNSPPPPRYHHSCHVVGNRVALYGGINPKQAFDAVVLLETNFGSDLSAVAEELARMTGCPSPAAAAAAAEALEGQLKLVQADKLALQKEILQHKLMTSEAEEVNHRLQQQLAEVQRGLQREEAEHAATSAALSDVQERLECREQQLAEARQLLDSMSAFFSSTEAAASVCVERLSTVGTGAELLGPVGSGPSTAGLATAAVAACAQEASQYRQFLSISELARNRLEAENATLQQQLEELQSSMQEQQHQLRVLQGQPTALEACSIEELTALEGKLESCTKAVRQVVLQRSIAESQRQANADSLRCAVCLEAPRRLAFNCGHQTCDGCGNKMMSCPFCRQTITAKIRLFE